MLQLPPPHICPPSFSQIITLLRRRPFSSFVCARKSATSAGLCNTKQMVEREHPGKHGRKRDNYKTNAPPNSRVWSTVYSSLLYWCVVFPGFSSWQRRTMLTRKSSSPRERVWVLPAKPKACCYEHECWEVMLVDRREQIEPCHVKSMACCFGQLGVWWNFSVCPRGTLCRTWRVVTPHR